MKYFETARVHSVEAREVFEEETQVSLQRKQAGQKVLEEKTQALVELAKTVDPALPDWSVAELDAQASQLFGMLIDEDSRHRAQISALVQFCSSSEWVLDDYFWYPGIRPERIVITRKALAKIIQSYPHLSDVALERAKKKKKKKKEKGRRKFSNRRFSGVSCTVSVLLRSSAAPACGCSMVQEAKSSLI